MGDLQAQTLVVICAGNGVFECARLAGLLRSEPWQARGGGVLRGLRARQDGGQMMTRSPEPRLHVTHANTVGTATPTGRRGPS